MKEASAAAVLELLATKGWRPALKHEQPGAWITIVSKVSGVLHVRCVPLGDKKLH